MNSDDDDEWATLGFEVPKAAAVPCTRNRALLPISASSDESEDEASASPPAAAAVAPATACKAFLPTINTTVSCLESDDDDDRNEGMEEVCFLQVPNDVAEKLTRMLWLQGARGSSSSSSTSPTTSVQVIFDETPGGGPRQTRLRVGDLELPGRLCNLPTVVEVHKSLHPESGTYHKCNQAGQMIVVDHDEAALPTERELPNGLSAPTARIRRRKWRKRNPPAYTAANMAHLEEELLCLAKNQPMPVEKELVWEDVYEDVPEGQEA